MSAPPTQPSQPDAPEAEKRPEAPAQKVGFAMTLGLLMIIVSTSTAAYTGYLLWKGDPGSEVLNTLPAGCSFVALAQDTAELEQALAQVPRWQALPASATLTEAAGALHRDLVADRAVLVADGGLGICRIPGGWVATLGHQGDDAIDVLQSVAAGRVGRSAGDWQAGQAVGGFVEYTLPRASGAGAHVAMLQASKRVVIVWAEGAGDASALLTRVVKDTRAKPMREDVTIRSAMERVGGGALQLGATPPEIRRWRAFGGAFPAELLDKHATFVGLSLRRADGETHLHLHVGTEQRGATWLKGTLDPAGSVAASAHLDADASAVGVLRVAPATLQRHGARLVGVPALAELGAALSPEAPAKGLATIAPVITGHALLQQGGGPSPWRLALQLSDAAKGRKLAEASASLATTRLGQGPQATDWLVFAPTDAAAAAADLAASAGQGAALGKEQQRLLDNNQGVILQPGAHLGRWLRGPSRLEALWLDTGFVAHLTFPTPR